MKSSIVMQSDFGLDSGYVASMHGICKLVDKELDIHDSTHLLPSFNIQSASFTLQYTVPYWPKGTVFVSVVDPTVGTNRRASAAKLKNGSYIVTPDNGTLTYVDKMIGIEEIREIDETAHRYEPTRDVNIFHGRDLFSYSAAKLASGIITFEEIGLKYPVENVKLHPYYSSEVLIGLVSAKVIGHDPFGSVNISVLNTEFKKARFSIGETVKVTINLGKEVIFKEKVIYHKAFAFVNQGENILFNDLDSFLSLGINQDNFVKKYNIKDNEVYDITIESI